MSSRPTLWYTRCPVPTAFSIAIQKGWIDQEFEQEDVDIRSLASSTDPQIRQAHFSAQLPNFLRHGGLVPPLMARSRGTDVRIVALSWNRAYRPVLALPESGIRTTEQLRGKRVSVPRRVRDGIDFWQATALRGLTLSLKRAGLGLDDVQQVDVPTGRAFVDDARSGAKANDSLWDAGYMLGHQREEAFALIRGQVDALYSHGAMAAILEGFLGATTVIDIGTTENGEAIYDAPYVLTASGQLIDEQPEYVARWLLRTLQAAEWAKHHEAEAKSILGVETGLPTELVDRAFSSAIHTELDLDLSPARIAALQAQHDTLDSNGFLQSRVDFSRFIDPRPLAAAQALLQVAQAR